MHNSIPQCGLSKWKTVKLPENAVSLGLNALFLVGRAVCGHSGVGLEAPTTSHYQWFVERAWAAPRFPIRDILGSRRPHTTRRFTERGGRRGLV